MIKIYRLNRFCKFAWHVNLGGVCVRVRSACRGPHCQNLPTEKDDMLNSECRSTVALVAGDKNTLAMNAQPHGTNVKAVGSLVTL